MQNKRKSEGFYVDWNDDGVLPEGHRAPPSLAAAVQAMSAIQVLPLRSGSVGRL